MSSMSAVSPSAQVVSVNGQITDGWDARILLRDHGALFAENVFEGLRIISGAILDFAKHKQRLFGSAERLRLALPTSEGFDHQVRSALAASQVKQGYMRIVATRGAGGLGIDPRPCKEPQLFIFVGPFALYPEETYEAGVAVIIPRTRKIAKSAIDCTEIKHGNYLNNKLALYEALDVEAHDSLMLTAEGWVSEATVANVFAVRENTLFTPALETNCLRGITRATVIELARERGLLIEEGLFDADFFRSADEVFLSGTGAGLLPVRSIDGQAVGSGRMGDVTRELRREFERLVQMNLERF